MVLNELDRINRDRSKILQKMSLVVREVSSLEEKLGVGDNADKLNCDL